MDNLFDLTERTALITGASSGLGVQYAQGLAAHGAKLVLTARRMERLEALTADFRAQGVECLPIRVDITDEDSVKEMVQKAITYFGHIDILVNNAGVATGTPAESLSTAAFEQTLRTNLVGAFMVSREVGKHMISRRYGRIINTCSIQAIRCTFGMPGSDYNVSKAGDVTLVKSLAAEWAKYGITVNGIGPGYFPTDIDREYLETEQFKNQLATHCPMGRVGRDGELNGALVYLASEAASYTTGQIIYVDGGWTLV